MKKESNKYGFKPILAISLIVLAYWLSSNYNDMFGIFGGIVWLTVLVFLFSLGGLSAWQERNSSKSDSDEGKRPLVVNDKNFKSTVAQIGYSVTITLVVWFVILLGLFLVDWNEHRKDAQKRESFITQNFYHLEDQYALVSYKDEVTYDENGIPTHIASSFAIEGIKEDYIDVVFIYGSETYDIVRSPVVRRNFEEGIAAFELEIEVSDTERVILAKQRFRDDLGVHLLIQTPNIITVENSDFWDGSHRERFYFASNDFSQDWRYWKNARVGEYEYSSPVPVFYTRTLESELNIKKISED